MNQYPVLAEEAVVPASVLAAVPDSFSAVEAAAVWMQYSTAYGALVPFGKVAAGDFVIITAASSSVGIAAIQIVKAQGGISIATTRTSAKKDQLIALGADHVIVTEEEDLVARVQSITGDKGGQCITLRRQPALPQTGKSVRFATLQADGVGLASLPRPALPLVKSIGGNQAATLFERFTESRFRGSIDSSQHLWLVGSPIKVAGRLV
jgi:D-arabinose 1-dehydrogenase-like Zn-dependent alcohol dehydrogenase